MKKVTTEYVCATQKGESFKIIVNEDFIPAEGKQMQIEFSTERWRSKEETIKFLKAITAELEKTVI